MSNESSIVAQLQVVMAYIRGLPPGRQVHAIDRAISGVRTLANELLTLREHLDPNTPVSKYLSRRLISRRHRQPKDHTRDDNVFSVDMAGASLTPFERIEAIGYTISEQGPTRIGDLADQIKDSVASIYRALNATGYRRYFCKRPQGVSLTPVGAVRFRIRKTRAEPAPVPVDAHQRTD